MHLAHQAVAVRCSGGAAGDRGRGIQHRIGGTAGPEDPDGTTPARRRQPRRVGAHRVERVLRIGGPAGAEGGVECLAFADIARVNHEGAEASPSRVPFVLKVRSNIREPIRRSRDAGGIQPRGQAECPQLDILRPKHPLIGEPPIGRQAFDRPGR